VIVPASGIVAQVLEPICVIGAATPCGRIDLSLGARHCVVS